MAGGGGLVWVLRMGSLVMTHLVYLYATIIYSYLKVHNVFPKVTCPPWLRPVKIWLQTVSG